MEKESILLVEDEINVIQFMKLELEHEGYDVTTARDGEEAMARFQEKEWSVILLDWMIPKLDGLEVCRRIRKTSSVPIIILTARDYVGDKILGLDRGADDYITKPFEIEELLARIRAVLRRAQSQSKQQDEDKLTIANLEVNVKSRRVVRENNEIELTQREFDLLVFLMKHEGEALSREWLLSAVWGYDFVGETNVVDVYIRYLRNKLDRDYEPMLIHTVRGIGYILRSS
ncbi:response regulator transcription factor [Alkalihalobacillus hwajinpoensis]|uniref:response regulator transcription factor n=1 Tax=Guptibacillus hwajinpoensis TaxID=208199 RepID=UPI001883B943|nr:response regulator transcription factor [Pseudalkalibacillus hwajinpoensis]MBF0707568.1 response regulator transcription factor [Pseudalkalibacillus hwajinpoensis]